MKVSQLGIAVAAILCPFQSIAQGAPERHPFRGGPLDGVRVGEVIRPDNGVRIVGLKPSLPNASPLPPQDEPAVRAFVEAFERRDISKLDGFLTKNAAQRICGHGFYAGCGPKRPFSELKVGEETTFNTPYYLGNHAVRLEWLFRGELVLVRGLFV